MADLGQIIDEITLQMFQKLGPCHREYIYRKALALELKNRGLFVEEEVHIPITYPLKSKKITLGVEIADIIIDQACILELKCGSPKPATLSSALGQARRYLRFYNGVTKVAFVLFVGPEGVQKYRVHNEF